MIVEIGSCVEDAAFCWASSGVLIIDAAEVRYQPSKNIRIQFCEGAGDVANGTALKTFRSALNPAETRNN